MQVESPLRVDLSVELPDPDAVLVSIQSMYDGTWVVTVCDRLGVGVDHIHSARAATALEASQATASALTKSIADRRQKAQELATSRAARSGAAPGPAIPLPGRPPARLGARPSPPSGSAVTGGSLGYTGSVPRNAAEWIVDPGAVTVSLKTGLVWPDTRTTERRVFPTIRTAKDLTRGALYE